MNIYFVRHSEAEDGVDDKLRQLTPNGIIQSQKVGQFLNKLGVEFDAAFTSPLIRAKQTSELITSITNSKNPVQVIETETLLNETTQKVFNNWLKTLLDYNNVLLVGHSPSINKRVAKLLGCEPINSIKMSKASIAWIKTEDGINGILKLFVSHKQL